MESLQKALGTATSIGLVLAGISFAPPAQADDMPPTAPASTGTTSGRDDGASGSAIPGVVVVIVGAAAVAIGSTILIVGTIADENEELATPALSAGFNGSNGRGTTAAPTPTEEDTGGGFDHYDAAAVAMGAGALVIGIGVALLASSSHGGDERAASGERAPSARRDPPRVTAQPLLGPGAAGVRLRF